MSLLYIFIAVETSEVKSTIKSSLIKIAACFLRFLPPNFLVSKQLSQLQNGSGHPIAPVPIKCYFHNFVFTFLLFFILIFIFFLKRKHFPNVW